MSSLDWLYISMWFALSWLDLNTNLAFRSSAVLSYSTCTWAHTNLKSTYSLRVKAQSLAGGTMNDDNELLPSWTCTGCQRDCRSRKGLANHVARCPKASNINSEAHQFSKWTLGRISQRQSNQHGSLGEESSRMRSHGNDPNVRTLWLLNDGNQASHYTAVLLQYWLITFKF
jgi:hypothetical protein